MQCVSLPWESYRTPGENHAEWCVVHESSARFGRTRGARMAPREGRAARDKGRAGGAFGRGPLSDQGLSELLPPTDVATPATAATPTKA